MLQQEISIAQNWMRKMNVILRSLKHGELIHCGHYILWPIFSVVIVDHSISLIEWEKKKKIVIERIIKREKKTRCNGTELGLCFGHSERLGNSFGRTNEIDWDRGKTNRIISTTALNRPGSPLAILSAMCCYTDRIGFILKNVWSDRIRNENHTWRKKCTSSDRSLDSFSTGLNGQIGCLTRNNHIFFLIQKLT